MNLTAANTAIVLDSTGDFPEAPDRFPNWRIVPLYVRFGEDSYTRLRRALARRVLRASCAPPRRCRPPRSRRPATSSPRTKSSRRTSASTRSTSPARCRARSRAPAPRRAMLGGDQVRVVDSGTASAAIALLGAGDPAAPRARGRPTRRSRRWSTASAPARTCSSPSRRSSTSPRAGASAGRARRPGSSCNVKPILTIEDGEIVPVKRVHGSHKAMQAFVDAFSGDQRGRARAARGHRARRRAGAAGRARGDGRDRAPAGADRPRDRTSARSSAPTRAGHGRLFWFTDS